MDGRDMQIPRPMNRGWPSDPPLTKIMQYQVFSFFVEDFPTHSLELQGTGNLPVSLGYRIIFFGEIGGREYTQLTHVCKKGYYRIRAKNWPEFKNVGIIYN